MGQLLRNDHNVYILGAGFSREAGLPLIHDFLSQMRDGYDWLVQQNRDQEARAVNDVLRFRLAAASAAYWVNLDLENIEELFSLAFANSDNIATSVRVAIAATLDYSRKLNGTHKRQINVRNSPGLFKPKEGVWPKWMKRTSSDAEFAHGNDHYQIGLYALYVARLLGMLKTGEPQGENTFITFNYDTLLEDAMEELGLSVTYGSRIMPRLDNGETADPANTRKENKEPISVFKLHGSVNWTRSGGAEAPLTVLKDYEALTKVGDIPELIPPTWKKVFENEIESIWGEAIEKLNTATRIIIIGFSMPPTDMHFKYLLAAGLKKNISLRQVLFVNPDPKDELKPRVSKMLREAYIESGQIAFVKAGLGQFTAQNPMNGVTLHQLGRPTEQGLAYDVFSIT